MLLSELKALAEKATPGPWDVGTVTTSEGQSFAFNASGPLHRMGDPVTSESRNLAYSKARADRDWIAASNPAVVLELIARLEAMETTLQEYVLGHTHHEDDKHFRPLGDTYGWCDYCSTRVGMEGQPGCDPAAECISLHGSQVPLGGGR
jgi:hypothetical protein